MANETPSDAYAEWGDERVRSKIGVNPISALLFLIGAAAALFVAFPLRESPLVALGVAAGCLALAVLVGLMPRVANEWERAVILRFGRFRGVGGPGVFWVIPFVERVALWADLRVRTT